MKIRNKELYHGAALLRIVEDKSFTALNSVRGEYGHYLLNADRHLFVKVTTKAAPPWQFSYNRDDIAKIARVLGSGKVFICLVCGRMAVCALNQAEMQHLLQMSAANQQWIRVQSPKGGSCHMSGSNGKLKRAIARNAFPKKVLA